MRVTLIGLAFAFVWSSPAQDFGSENLAPFLPSPQLVVEKMLEAAHIKAGEIVYDLGSGDGRIVIAAAREFGARGVGIEIDPQLVAQSAESARRAGVGDRVRFSAGDLFEADLSDATVVTLYLSPELNLRLRPKLLRELRPGSRIVSHDFDMGDWPPSQTIRVASRDRVSNVFLWVVPPKTARAR